MVLVWVLKGKNLGFFPRRLASLFLAGARFSSMKICDGFKSSDITSKLSTAHVLAGKKYLKQKIEIIDKQIDDLIYKLYNITDEEIKIIEEKNDKK